jgi:Xaa-Pro dipeptidase
VIAGILRDRGAANGKVGFEERVRFFIFDGVRQRLSSAQYVTATPGHRRLSHDQSRPAEIALMQRANDITLQAIADGFKSMKEGMTKPGARRERRRGNAEARRHRRRRTRHLRKVHAFPHGSVQPQKLRRERRRADRRRLAPSRATRPDITRTTVFGKPTQRMRDVWETEKKAQNAAFAAAKVGATCESVDAAARKVITDAGFGPGYKTPGLPHRTGHRHRSGWPRVDELREGKHDEDPIRHVLQRRADDRDLRRVRHPSGGLSARDGEWAEVFSPNRASRLNCPCSGSRALMAIREVSGL